MTSWLRRLAGNLPAAAALVFGVAFILAALRFVALGVAFEWPSAQLLGLLIGSVLLLAIAITVIRDA